MNPTTDVLEQRVAALEGGVAGLAFASGMAAITGAHQHAVRCGRRDRLHHAPLWRHRHAPGQYTCRAWASAPIWVDSDEPAAFAAAITERTKARLSGDDRQPQADHPRSGGHRRGGPRARRAGGGGQHHRLAGPVPPHRARRGHRHAQPDQVPGRPRQLDRRHPGGWRQVPLGQRALSRVRRARRQLPRPALLQDLRQPDLCAARARTHPARHRAPASARSTPS